jgi:hypothetical protein
VLKHQAVDQFFSALMQDLQDFRVVAEVFDTR